MPGNTLKRIKKTVSVGSFGAGSQFQSVLWAIFSLRFIPPFAGPRLPNPLPPYLACKWPELAASISTRISNAIERAIKIPSAGQSVSASYWHIWL